MKKLIALITLLIATTTWAVTVITYNVPDIYGAKLLAALTAQSDSDVRIQIRGHKGAGAGNTGQYKCDVAFYVPPRDPNLSNGDFVKGRMALLADAMRAGHDQKLKDKADKAYLAAMPVIDVNAPDSNEMN